MDLKTELLEFIEANNYFNLGGLSNAEGCVDAYLQAYSKQLMQTAVVGQSEQLTCENHPYGNTYTSITGALCCVECFEVIKAS